MKANDKLGEKAKQIRLEVLEKSFLTGKAHLGSTFSVCDILVSLFYGNLMNINSANVNKSDRDRFILSKGHACLAIYSIYKDIGLINKKTFDTYGKDGGLGGQLDMSVPSVDFNTGSLGHAVSVGCGIALSAKLNGYKQRVFVIMGDSELFEGSVWEGIIFAGDNHLENLICIVDRNRFMVTDEITSNSIYLNFKIKIESFGWNYFEMDGHNFKNIQETVTNARRSKGPSMIVANTIKGKGVSFMENGLGWYTQTPTSEEYKKAKGELENGQ